MSDDLRSRLLQAAQKADADVVAKKEAETRKLTAQQQEERDRFIETAETLERLFGPVLTAALGAYGNLPTPFHRKDRLDFEKAKKYEAPSIEFGFGTDIAQVTIYMSVNINFPGKHQGDSWWDRAADFNMSTVESITDDKVFALVEHLLRQHKGLEKKYRF